MSNIEYNTDFLVKVKTVFDKDSQLKYYSKPLKFLGMVIRPKGYYVFDRSSMRYYKGDKFSNLYKHYHYYIKDEDENKKVQSLYYKPHVILHYVDGSYKEYFFEPDEKEKAKKFADKFTVDKNWI